MFILELIAEFFFEIAGSWFFGTLEKSYLGFIRKTIVRLMVLGLIIFVSYQFHLTETTSFNFFLGLSAFFSLIFFILTYNSYRSLKHIKRD